MPDFKALLGAIPDAVVGVDRGGLIRLVNLQAAAMFGVSGADLIGHPIEALIPEHCRAAYLRFRDAFLENPGRRPMRVGLDLMARRADGAEFPVEINLSLLGVDEGRLVLAFVRDISERKRIEAERAELLTASETSREELQRLLTITDVALSHLSIDELLSELIERIQSVLRVDSAVVLRLDPDRDVLVPWGAGGLLAREAESRVEIPLGEGFAGRVAAERRTIAVRDTEAVDIVNPLVRELGVRSLLGTPLMSAGALVGVLHVGTVEPRVFQPADVDLLERVAGRIALAIENALLYRQANDAIRAREAFLSMAAHELKTPLTTVKGWVHLLHQSLAGTEDLRRDELTDFSAALEEQVDRFEGLINDLLDASRIQQGQFELEPEPMDLVSLTRRVIARFEHAPERTERHHIRLYAPSVATGVWDPERLTQVLTNLLSNALKYSPNGGDIDVTIDVGDVEVTLSVRDQGIGIADPDLATLFNPFTRTAAARQAATGTGLGLHIVQQILQQHGGSLQVESKVGQGSLFRVTLPRFTLAEIDHD